MFEAIRISSALFSSDEVRLVAAGKEEGQRAADYDEPGKLDVRMNEDFRRLEQAWDSQFKVQKNNVEDAERITVDAWLRYVFGVLGFGSLRPVSGLSVGGTRYDIHYQWKPTTEAPGIPIHVVPHTQELEERSGRGRNAHSTLQEYLTRCDATWGIVTNGLRWRILRDNATHTRPSFLEFDLEAIMDGKLFDEFAVFWQFSHATRFPDEPGWLETWMKNGQRKGTRAVDRLRQQVRTAIEALGQGFLRNTRNHDLRRKLESGELSEQEYFHQVLRLVYRMLFLLVTEARGLLLFQADGQSEADWKRARRAYEEYYSMRRLRGIVDKKFTGTKHHDLWEALKVVMQGLRDPDGLPALGLPPLGRKVPEYLRPLEPSLRRATAGIWDEEFIPHLEASRIENQYLLQAISALNEVRTEYGPQRIDYANLGAEELGSVYEGLLEVKPVVDVEKNRFRIDSKGGDERRTTGSHYTPTDLIDKVLDHALDPLLDEAEEKGETSQENEKSLLELTVCDPTCGSGHFLIAAAHRIARRVATHRYGEPEPTPGHLRTALRDVISRCIYGVDINPMSVELCKVSLWLEAMEPGKPLAYLDHHIKCGNALLGAFPEYLEKGIPDEAYKVRPGIDNPEVCKALKEINKKVPMSQETLKHFKEDRKRIQDYLVHTLEEIEAMPTDTVEQIEAKEEAYRTKYLETHEYERYKLALDAWCAAFSYSKVSLGSEANIGNPEIIDVLHGEGIVDDPFLRLVSEQYAAANNRFLHWPIEFPQVFARGGFSTAIGNPPYIGGGKVSGRLGAHYNHFLKAIFEPYSTLGDLASGIVRKEAALVDLQRGRLGFITTNNISKSTTRDNALRPLVAGGWAIAAAFPDVVWPGDAAVIVAIVVLARHADQSVLHGAPVQILNSALEPLPEVEPGPLRSRKSIAFLGNFTMGKGFLIEPRQAHSWIKSDARNADVLHPFQTGEDLFGAVGGEPSRWTICFRDWAIEQAIQYSLPFEHVERTVKLERQDNNRPQYRELWWRYGEYRKELAEKLEGSADQLVHPRVTETPLFIRMGTEVMASGMSIIFLPATWQLVGETNSAIHEVWYRKQGSGMHQRVRYTPNSCFETFPVPNDSPEVARLGEAFHETVLSHAKTRGIALTPLWNLVNGPECHDDDIEEIRRLRNELTVAVAEAFETPPIEFEFGFYKDHAGRDRYTMSPAAQEQVYLELVRLNAEQAAAEKAGNGGSRKHSKVKQAKGQSKLNGAKQVRL